MGKNASDEEVKKLPRLVINGAKGTAWDDLTKEIINERTFRLDPTAKPKTIDFKVISGFGKGKTDLAIYELDGDTLKICYAMGEGAKRPTEFKSVAGTKLYLVTYNRTKE